MWKAIMASSAPQRTGLQLRSRVKTSGELELSLVEVEVPAPVANEVVVRVEASPINPSDIALLFGAADMSTARQSGTPERPVITARVPDALMRTMAGRFDQSLPVGNEGAGIVVDAGSGAEARSLLGKTVALFGGAMYAQYRCAKAAQCMALPPGTTPAAGASCYVNPLTALGMVETMRLEGHRALVHTAAASNLGQMLNRICLEDGIGLVNIVRSREQEGLLRGIGAKHVCDSTAPSFVQDLTEAIATTGATLAFDAVGGGKLAGQILACMETVLGRSATEYNRYGSATHKQVYVYGILDPGPIVLNRGMGFAWGVGGWLLPLFLQKIGPEAAQRLRERVLARLDTTFASRYARELSLAGMLHLDEIAAYSRRATGAKVLVNPNKA
jgi:NADPH2:quinone reductase